MDLYCLQYNLELIIITPYYLQASLLLSTISPEIVGKPVEANRLYDAINCLMSWMVSIFKVLSDLLSTVLTGICMLCFNVKLCILWHCVHYVNFSILEWLNQFDFEAFRNKVEVYSMPFNVVLFVSAFLSSGKRLRRCYWMLG